jgi:hypothetical protein
MSKIKFLKILSIPKLILFLLSQMTLLLPAVNADLIIPAVGLIETSNTAGQRSAALNSYINSLLNVANSTLTNPLKSVMDKPGIGPSGDKHDYLSLATYYWPNPDTADGLPFVARDGFANPTNANFDTPRLNRLMKKYVDIKTFGGFCQPSLLAIRI